MSAATASMIQSLTTVRDAVSDALRTASRALTESGSAAANAAADAWRSAHAAMQVVNHGALLKFSTELGALLSAADGDLKSDRAAAFAAGSEALIDYMNSVIAGRRDQPLRLWPAYDTLQRARGVAQPSESDLFFPNLDVGPEARADAVPLSADELRNLRRQLEGGLLQWLRKGERTGLQHISDAVTRVEAAQQGVAARRLWWVARAVLEALLEGGLSADTQVRRLLTQLNLHLGRLLQGPAETPEPLWREALYLAARAKPVTPLVVDVQQQCRLQGALELEAAAPAGFTADALAAARGQSQGLQDLWSACAGGTAGFAEFEHRARGLSGACEPLGERALTGLVEQLADTAHAIAKPGTPTQVREAAVLEGACALLMIDHVLAQDQPPDAGFAQRAGHMASRLKVSIDAPQALGALPPAQWLDDSAHAAMLAEQANLVRAEIGNDLRAVEPALESWRGNPGDPGLAVALDKPLRRIAGAFSVLGHEEAAIRAGQIRNDVNRCVLNAGCSADEGQFLAKQISALSIFVEALRHGPATLDPLEIPAVQEVLQPQPQLAEKAPLLELVLPDMAAPAPEPETPIAAAAEQTVTPASVQAATAPIDGAADTDPEMLEIFLEEAGDVLNTIADTAPQSRAQPQDQELLTALRRAFHTLKGSGRMVGLTHLAEAAWDMEQVFNEKSQEKLPGTPDLYRLVDFAHGNFTRWIDDLRSHKQAAIDAGQLSDWAKRVRAGEALPVVPQVEQPAEKPVEPSIELPVLTMPIVEPEAPVAEPAAITEHLLVGEVRVSRALYDIMLPEARETLTVLAAQNGLVQDGGKIAPDYVRAAHTLSGISGSAGMHAIRALSASLERVLEQAVNADVELPSDARAVTARAVAALHEQVAAMEALAPPAAHPELVAALDSLNIQRAIVQPVIEAAAPTTPMPPVVEASAPTLTLTAAAPLTSTSVITRQLPVADAVSGKSTPDAVTGDRRRYRLNDDVDAQLLPIFLEEAAELVPQVGQDLRAWRTRPDDKLVAQSLKRLLHTLKGSARMAGAMALGQLTHSMESRIENAQRLPSIPEQLIDELEGSFDRIGALISQLQEGEIPGAVTATALPQAMEEMSRTQRIATASGEMTQMLPAQYPGDYDAAAGQTPGVPRPLIRVRADLIDRLANQAGEVSIARARISAELRSARGSLRELTENVSRLRAQLRELEIQAETQMQSRFSTTPEQTGGKFDPLEFDRFTRLQELTRLMAESVNDVATVQHSLARDLDEGEKALASQAQTTREVQQDLMAIRMVSFSSISDRLYRVTRLSAKDSEKRVGLDIVGEQVELDRSVMERVAAPIEHLLRNAIVHGIEAPQRRIDIGKPEAGALKLEVRQEGNEVVLAMSDDGDGLNIARIREKAIDLGMMREDEQLTDQQISQFIFRSGFSTAEAVTTEAGRGVGMDVVMSEITALGGRVDTESARGKGTTFIIHLPLTLSVLQAVVMRLGGNYYAVPTMMVEQVQRLKTEVLNAASAARAIEWQGVTYPFHHLATLLELQQGDEAPPQYGSVLLLRSGSNRAAIQVDDIVGGQEIVIKNIGPQLARVPGVTGAAVLGSGETVLILNPVLLTARHFDAMEAAKVLQPAAVAALLPAEPERQCNVLVVDDSLTVRKITDRLLTREGYRVAVAKDGVEALEKLRDHMPDVMITDVEMPRMDGFDLVRNVRADEALKALPIIMITSRTAEKHRQHATEIGVDVFLGKPYEEGELLGHISTLSRRVTVS